MLKVDLCQTSVMAFEALKLKGNHHVGFYQFPISSDGLLVHWLDVYSTVLNWGIHWLGTRLQVHLLLSHLIGVHWLGTRLQENLLLFHICLTQ